MRAFLHHGWKLWLIIARHFSYPAFASLRDLSAEYIKLCKPRWTDVKGVDYKAWEKWVNAQKVESVPNIGSDDVCLQELSCFVAACDLVCKAEVGHAGPAKWCEGLEQVKDLQCIPSAVAALYNVGLRQQDRNLIRRYQQTNLRWGSNACVLNDGDESPNPDCDVVVGHTYICLFDVAGIEASNQKATAFTQPVFSPCQINILW